MNARNTFTAMLTLVALTIVSSASVAQAALMQIDFGRAGVSSPTQAGYTPYNITDPGGSAFSDSMAFATDVGVGGSATVTVIGSTNSYTRDYPVLTGGPDIGLTNLLQDHVFLNAAGTMTLRLSNLKDGEYSITTYHHNSSAQIGSVFDLSLTDAVVTNSLLFDDVTETDGTTPNPALQLSFSFEVIGGNDVDITLVAAGGGHAGFNGFDLELPEVPEPSSFLLLGLGTLGLVRHARRRRRRA